MVRQLSAAERRDLNVDPSRWAWLSATHSPTQTTQAPAPEAVVAHYLGSATRSAPAKDRQPQRSSRRYLALAALLAVSVALLASLPATILSESQAGQWGVIAAQFVVLVTLARLWRSFAKGGSQDSAPSPRTPDSVVLESPAFPLPNMIFGSPGVVGASPNTFGAAEVSAGVRGEEATARLLEFLLEIPGVNVFHGLRFPGSAEADVDHAVVHGESIYLIDSKQYRPGVYSWGRGSEIVSGNGSPGFPNHMAAAREGYERMFPGARVHALVLIHGAGVSIGPRDLQNGVRLALAQWTLAYLGDSLAAETRSGWSEYDNSAIMGGLLHNLK